MYPIPIEEEEKEEEFPYTLFIMLILLLSFLSGRFGGIEYPIVLAILLFFFIKYPREIKRGIDKFRNLKIESGGGMEADLRDLFKLIVRMVITYIITFAILFIIPENFDFNSFMNGTYSPLIVSLFIGLVKNYVSGFTLAGISLIAPFEIWVKIALFTSLLIIAPYIIIETYLFVKEGLYEHEKREVRKFLIWFPIFFYLGVFFALFLLIPTFYRVMYVLFKIMKVDTVISVTSAINTIIYFALATGLLFMSTPLLAILLKFGIIEVRTLQENRLPIYLGLLLVVMFITPGGDILSNVMLFLPLVALYEGVILYGKKVKKKRV